MKLSHPTAVGLYTESFPPAAEWLEGRGLEASANIRLVGDETTGREMNFCYIGAKDNCGNWASGNVVPWGKSLTDLSPASSRDSVGMIKKLATDVSDEVVRLRLSVDFHQSPCVFTLNQIYSVNKQVGFKVLYKEQLKANAPDSNRIWSSGLNCAVMLNPQSWLDLGVKVFVVNQRVSNGSTVNKWCIMIYNNMIIIHKFWKALKYRKWLPERNTL